MKDLGDEYFTTAVCDLIRLCVCPLLLTSIWFLFLHGVEQVKEIYGEVDSALRSKQYQITYTADGDPKKSRHNTHKASATVLPAPSSSVFSLPAKKTDNATGSEPNAISSAIATAAASVAANVSEAASSADKNTSAEKEETKADNTKSDSENKDSDSSAENEEKAPNVPADVAAAIAAIDDPVTSNEPNDEIIADFAAEARKAVAKTSSAAKARPQQQSKPQPQNNSQQKKRQPSQNPQQRKQQRPQGSVQNQPAKPKAGTSAPVQEFDPFPADSVPRRPQQSGQQARNNTRQGGHNPGSRPQGGRPAQRGNNPGNRAPSGNNPQRNNPGRR